ncbi:MAG: filamentous hemagglutinin N-terminal domain-containing protein, partial [Zoogloeaceae bacterium]|nr:filamentous hemagglutinin N-terminal domain-containing protein [Zoogloeaceae bacterium]
MPNFPAFFPVRVISGFLLLCAPVLVHAQIIADPGAPGNQRPVVTGTGNGLPLVNITTPSGSGVSINQYRQFDVQRPGVLLNNNRAPQVATQLGGYVPANPYLAGGAARVIVNQVNSANPSYLGGPIEIAGSRADLVIANPSGLNIDGAVILNANRVTLAAGQVNLAQGALTGFDITAGQINIEGLGLDARDAGYTELLARSIELNAQIHAQDLALLAGQNRISADGAIQSGPPETPAPAFALDVKALGGMYAGQIRLIGTEAGVGVRNQGEVIAAGALTLTSAGELTNGGRMVGGDLGLSAPAIHNQGEIAATGKLQLAAADALVNDGRIIGGDVRIAAARLANQGLDLTDATPAPVIAAGGDLTLAVDELKNTHHGLIYAGQDLSIGGLTNAAADLIENASATIEAQRNLTIAVAELKNLNLDFRTQTVVCAQAGDCQQTSEINGQEFDMSSDTRYGQQRPWYVYPESYGSNASLNAQLEYGELYDDDNEPIIIMKGVGKSGWWRFRYTRQVEEEQLLNSDPGRIIAGGDLTIDGASLLNDKSQILAGGVLAVLAQDIQNIGYEGKVTVIDSGTASQVRRKKRRGDDTQRWTNYAYLDDRSFTYHLAGDFGGGQSGITQPLAGGLFKPADPASPYLFAADPFLISLKDYLSSDYYFQQLQLDPANAQKRLGDGFYEQRLIQEQVAQLTGQRYLAGYADDQAQYRALMESGLAYAQTWGLIPGVALSAEQMAQLTTPMVWLVEEQVTLPDGSQVSALAPRLYLAAGAAAPANAGLMAARQVEILASGELKNSATIQSQTQLLLAATDIRNDGRLAGAQVIALAGNDLQNSGVIEATDAIRLQAGNDLALRTTTTSNQTAIGERTTLNQSARVELGENAQGELILQAGRNLTLDAAALINRAESSQTVIAAGGDINLGTVKTDYEMRFGAARREAMTEEHGSLIATQGDLTLAAANDLTAQGAYLNSAAGRIQLMAGNDLTLATAQSTTDVQNKVKDSGSNGLLSSGSQTQYWDTQTETQTGTVISAAAVSIIAGHDATLSGASVVADGAVQIAAANDLTIESAQNRVTAHYQKQEKK